MGQLITVTKSMKLYAKYQKKVHNVYVGNVPAFATVVIKDKNNNDATDFEYGETYYMTIEAEKPNVIDTFRINGVDRKSDLVVSKTELATTYTLQEAIKENKDVTMTFSSEVTHSVSVSVAAGEGYAGVKDKAEGGVNITEVQDGGSYVIAVDPSGAEELESVTVNGVDITDRFFDEGGTLIWYTVIDNVTEDQVVVVSFRQPSEHLVEFFNINSEKISEETVAHNGTLELPDAPVVEGHDFVEWEERA